MTSRKTVLYMLAAAVTLLVSALVACTRSASLTPAPQQAAPSSTSALASTESLTATVEPDHTASPTITQPDPTTPTPTAEPPSNDPTPTPNLNLYNRQASISQSPQGRYQVRMIVSFPENPNGELIGDQYHSLVEMTDMVESRTITLVDEWSNYGLGLTTPHILGWGAQGAFLYIGERGVPDGCGPPFTQNVRQVNTQNGESTPFELSIRGPWAISEGGDILGYVQEAALVVFDLMDQSEMRISFSPPELDWWPTSLVWSPSGDMALLSIITSPCGPPDNRQGWIYKISVAEKTSEALIQGDNRTFSLLSWPLEGYAQMSDSEGTIWWTDTLSGDVAQAPPSQAAQAQLALVSFFEALNQGQYAQAERWFGGSYEGLVSINPSTDPSDYAALWQAACETNGFQCLQVNQAILEGKPSPERYRFRVSFVDAEGGLFVRGPCCGADEIDMPPRWEFPFIVEQSESGEFKVLDLPVYVP